PGDFRQNYDYQMAWANVYSQRHNTLQALSAFAQANQQAADDPTAERALLEVAGQEGAPVIPNLNMQTQFSTDAVYEDSTIYELDNKLFGAPVPPRSQQGTQIGTVFHYHPRNFLPVSGYIGERNFRGTVSIPSQLLIIHRNTYDTIFNVGVAPALRVGNAHIVLNPSLEFTLRRDTDTPQQINQQLLRESLYV